MPGQELRLSGGPRVPAPQHRLTLSNGSLEHSARGGGGGGGAQMLNTGFCKRWTPSKNEKLRGSFFPHPPILFIYF